MDSLEKERERKEIQHRDLKKAAVAFYMKKRRILVKYDAGALDAKITIAHSTHITSLFR